MAGPAFQPGDTVAWSHDAGKYGVATVLREDALGELSDPSSRDHQSAAQIGEVVGVANDEGTWFDVDFAGTVRTLTADELVKVELGA